MILAKIRENGGKMMFFAINILLIIAGTFFLKQKNTEILKGTISEADAQNLKTATDYALAIQTRIIADNEAKLKSIANNSAAVVIQNTDNEDTAVPVESSKSLQNVNTEKSVSVPIQPVVAAAPAPAVVIAPTKTKGECGSSDSSAKRSNSNCKGKAPGSNLCSVGSASAITFKPNKYDTGWNWTCAGQDGGSSATCRCS